MGVTVIPHTWGTPIIPPQKKKRGGKIRGARPSMVIIDELAHWLKPTPPSSHFVIMKDGAIHDATTGVILTKHADSTSSVNHPKHYNQYRFEVIDLVEDMTFNSGNGVKYLTRAPFKGKELEDLKKALWYIKKEIKRVERKQKKEAKASKNKREGGRIDPPLNLHDVTNNYFTNGAGR